MKINKIKNIIIILLVIALGIITYFFITSQSKETSNIDGSKMSNTELLEMFKKENYTLKIQVFSSTPSTKYILLENEANGITIQRIYNNYIGTLMTFEDNTLNNEQADIMDTTQNKSKDEELQYKAYEKWLKKYNITKVQISNMLDYYYKNNSSSTEYIDINKFLN